MWSAGAVSLVLISSLFCASVSADGLVNEDVKRTLDLSTHLGKITAEIQLANHGASRAHSFTLALEPELAPHLAFIGASVSKSYNFSNKSASRQEWVMLNCELSLKIHWLSFNSNLFISDCYVLFKLYLELIFAIEPIGSATFHR